MHEICHKLGFEHEIARKDRDHAVQVDFSMITEEGKHQYEIEENTVAVGFFDYFSIMQYPQCNAFGISDEPCHVEKVKGDPKLTSQYRDGNELGKNVRLSPGDVRGLVLLYGSPQ